MYSKTDSYGPRFFFGQCKEEFQYGLSDTLSIETLNILPNDMVFVAYKWSWSDQGDEVEKGTDEYETVNYYEDENIDENIDEYDEYNEEHDTLNFDSSLVTHTVTFKCIGATRDNSHQTALQEAFESIQEGGDVLVRLSPEPKIQRQSLFSALLEINGEKLAML